MRLGIAFAASVVAIACCNCRQVPPPGPVPQADVACDSAWRRLEQLGCREAASPEGATFASTCRTVAAAGVDLHPACVARISSCEDVGPASRGEVCP